jgi:hypothetical protein
VKDYYHIELDNKTSDKELDFYYFQMHDFDHNLLLDGLEILTALNHAIDENSLRSREETTTAASQGSGRMVFIIIGIIKKKIFFLFWFNSILN